MVTVNALGECSSSLALGGFTTHVSKTMMLSELSLLLEAVPHDNLSDDYRRAVLDDNALLEKSDSTRRKSLKHLRELYVLHSPAATPLPSRRPSAAC